MKAALAAIFTLGVVAVVAAAGAPASPRQVRTKDGLSLRIETVVTGLEVPWSIAFTSPRRMLVTERPGRVRVVQDGALVAAPLATIPDVESSGETGLMGLAIAPDYAASKLLYLSYAYADTSGGGTAVRVAQYREEGSRLVRTKTIVENLPAARFHAGCRLRFGPDEKLYVTTGDATRRELAQRMDSLAGKTLRFEPDGGIPRDNPFPGSSIYSLGHRNSQGLDWQPGTGRQIQTEHGPSGFDGPGGGDEVNWVDAGKNYGWPLIHHREARPGLVSPLLGFTPAIAPAGGSFIHGNVLRSLAGDFVFTALRGERLVRVRFDRADPAKVASFENLVEGEYGRLREAMLGPDGALYVSTSNRDGRGQVRSGDDRILKITQE